MFELPDYGRRPLHSAGDRDYSAFSEVRRALGPGPLLGRRARRYAQALHRMDKALGILYLMPDSLRYRRDRYPV